MTIYRNISSFFCGSYTHLEFTAANPPPPDPPRPRFDVENARAHASNFLDFLANDDGIVSSNLGRAVLSVVERALVLVAVSMNCTKQAATSALEA